MIFRGGTKHFKYSLKKGCSMFLHKVFILNTVRAICIPQTLAKEYDLEKGDYVMVQGHRDGILIQKAVRVGDEVRVVTTRHDPRAKA